MNGSICLNDFCKCVFTLSSTATDRSLHSALVWRCTFRLVNVHAFLSTRVARGLQLCSRLKSFLQGKDAGGHSYDRIGCGLLDAADCS